MNEKSKLLIILAVIVLFTGLVIWSDTPSAKKSKEVYNTFATELNSNEKKIVFIGRPDCSWCQLFQPIFDYYADKYEFEYTYINANDLRTTEARKIGKAADIDELATPLVLFVQDGKVVEKISGYKDEKELLSILQKQEFIPADETNSLNYLDLKTLKERFNNKKRSAIVIGQVYCSACIAYKPNLMEVADTKDAEIYYININETEEQDEIIKYLEKYKEFQGDWGTPTTLIVEKGKIVASLSGYADSNTLTKFLTENKIIKE